MLQMNVTEPATDLNSCASSPQMCFDRLTFTIETTTSTPRSMTTSFITLPSLPTMGVESGTTSASFLATLATSVAGAYSRSVSRMTASR